MRLRMSLTQKCNLGCVYCSKEGFGDKKQLMTGEDYAFMIKSARDYFSEIDFTGGEPTLGDYLHRPNKRSKEQ